MTANTPMINKIIVNGQLFNGELPIEIKPQLFLLLKVADSMPDVWVTRSVAAYLIGVTKGTLEVWASTGNTDLPYHKCSRLARYRLGDIKDYIRQSTIPRKDKQIINQ